MVAQKPGGKLATVLQTPGGRGIIPRPMRTAAVLSLFLLAAAPVAAQTTSRRVGRVTVSVDQELAFPGGLLVVHLRSSRGIGGVQYAILDGRRCPFFPAAGGPRALVPIPATFRPGTYTLGVELRTRRGPQRIALTVTVAERRYPERTVVLPEAKRALAIQPGAVRDGRKLQLLLRTESPRQHWNGPFGAPVPAEPVYSYGAPTSYEGAFPVETTIDAVHGEYHRGIDYAVPAGTPVRAPAAGTVLMAADLALSGRTVVLDHGQGVVSLFFHLDRVDVLAGQPLAAGATLGLSGESGLAAEPHVHWAAYVHGVAIDPRVLGRLPL